MKKTVEELRMLFKTINELCPDWCGLIPKYPIENGCVDNDCMECWLHALIHTDIEEVDFTKWTE